MNNNYFPVIVAEGTPYEVGYIHGSEAKKQVEASLSTYQAMFKDFSNIDWEKAKLMARGYIKTIKDYDEELLEEMQGVADGAQKSLDDIIALNVRSEIVLAGKFLDGCTSLAFTPEITSNRETLIGQNWDWKLSQKEAFIVLTVKQKNKPSVFMFTEAGIIGKLGFNSSGLGVCLNALATNQKPMGIPLHLVLRGILNSRTLSDAIAVVGRAGVACPANFLCAHDEGEAITIESSSEDYDVIYGNEGFITHTNHFTSLRLVKIKDTGKLVFPDSFIRFGRVNKLIRKKLLDRKIDIKDVQEIFSDHIGYPDSICRHEDSEDDPGMRMATVISIIMNLDRREMYIAPGSPCSHRYDIYKM